jgi:hypothetical protein
MSPRLVALALLAFSSQALAAEGGGKLVKAVGHVNIRAPGAAADVAGREGQELAPGTQIRTGADGFAEVSFTDGSMLRIQKGSSVLLSVSRRQEQKSAILLFFGRVWSKVTPSKTGETNYEISTANAVCGVRGTEFETQVADDGSMRMQVTEGRVAVDGDSGEAVAGAGQQVEADESSVGGTAPAAGTPEYDRWQADKQARLRTQSEAIVKSIKGKVMTRQAKLEALTSQQRALKAKIKDAAKRAQDGDPNAADEVKTLRRQLAKVADQIADLGDEATVQVGVIDHFADLVNDPRFKGISRKYIELEAASLRRVKANLDKMVAEGTDMSMAGMDKMLDDMSKGKGSLREHQGSSAKDLFGGDEDMH